MIETHERFRMMDLDKKNNFFIEVNWNPNDDKTNQCKVLKIEFPNGDTTFLDRKHFNELLFAIGKPEDQQKMIPQTTETVHWRRTTLGVKATKDIRKGEMMNFPIEISFPCGLANEIIAGVKKPKTGDKSPLLLR